MKKISTCLTLGALVLSAGLFSTSMAEPAPAAAAEKPASAPAAPKAGMDAPKGPREGGPRAEGMRRTMNRQVFEFWNDEKVVAKLALKPEQVEKLKAAHAEAKPKLEAAEKKLAEIREKNKPAEKPAEGTAPPKMNEAGMAAAKEYQEVRKAYDEKIKSILTEEQGTQLREVMREKYAGGAGRGEGVGAGRGEGRRGGEGMKNEKKGGKESSEKKADKDDKPVVK